MRTSNLTIVFTDIKGFTERTGRQSHEENQRMLRLHDGLLMPVFRAFDGRLVKTIGDAFLVVFEAPTKAILCGIAIQDRLWEFNRRVQAADQIHVRVAVNVGEVREDKGDVFGEPVNIAARVEGLAEAGEVLFTEAVYLAMNKAEVPAEDRGVHELKGISNPIRVYRVPHGAYRLEADAPAAAPGTAGDGAAGPAPAGGGGGTAALALDGPPYGGLGLSRAGKLPPADPESLAKNTEIVPQLLAATTAVVSRAGDFQKELFRAGLPALRTASGSVSSRIGTLARAGHERFQALPPRHRHISIGATITVLVLLMFFGLRGDSVERAISSGDYKSARKEISKLTGTDKRIAEGKLHEAESSWRSAASAYEDAARKGDSRGYRALVRMTKNDKCPARAAGANALGTLGDTDAVSPLKRLADASFADEGGDSPLESIFGCSSKRAARDAIERLQRR